MSCSLSLHFVVPIRGSQGSKGISVSTGRVSTTIRARRASSPPPTATPAVDVSRLDPKVEKKDGKYWVLKEDHRNKINPQEKIKIDKEPMTLFMKGGIDRLASIPFEEIDSKKESKDDVDVRLKWLGLFHRRKRQCLHYFAN